jgi:hypothetical protein
MAGHVLLLLPKGERGRERETERGRESEREERKEREKEGRRGREYSKRPRGNAKPKLRGYRYFKTRASRLLLCLSPDRSIYLSHTLQVDMHCASVVLHGGTVLYGNASAEHGLKRKAYEKNNPDHAALHISPCGSISNCCHRTLRKSNGYRQAYWNRWCTGTCTQITSQFIISAVTITIKGCLAN